MKNHPMFQYEQIELFTGFSMSIREFQYEHGKLQYEHKLQYERLWVVV